MIESKIKENPKPTYSQPELVEGSGIILITTGKPIDEDELFKGTIVFFKGSENNHYSLGETRSDWLKEAFTLFNGELILKNK